MQLEERELVPISALEGNPSVNYVKEPAAAQPLRVAPFQDGQFSVLEKILRDADHSGRGKTGREHRSNSLVPFNLAFGYLMVDRARVVKGAQRINVRSIESFDPSLYDITRTHRSTLLNCRIGFQNSHILSRVERDRTDASRVTIPP